MNTAIRDDKVHTSNPTIIKILPIFIELIITKNTRLRREKMSRDSLCFICATSNVAQHLIEWQRELLPGFYRIFLKTFSLEGINNFPVLYNPPLIADDLLGYCRLCEYNRVL